MKGQQPDRLLPPEGVAPPLSRHDAALLRMWRLVAWIAGVFSALVGLMMLAGYFRTPTIDPLKSPELKAYKEQLRLNPADEDLKQRIRQVDLQLRQRYFRLLSQRESGVYLLLGGAAVFVFAACRAARCQRQLPLPQPRSELAAPAARAAAATRWSVAASGATVGALLFVIGFGLETALPRRAEDIDKLLGSGAGSGIATASDAALPFELARNWPRFRGAGGSGIALSTNAPIGWDTKTGTGILWKVPTPAAGFNSPLIWGDHVFFSGGDAAKREVFCLNGETGQLLWRQPVANVPGSPSQPPEIPDSTGYAASTMASDGRRVYVFFANGDVAAFTLEGKPVWSKGFGPLKNPYGCATSLATWQDRLILQLDQGESEESKSRLYALDGRTGQVIWQRPRKVGASWATPIVIEAAGKPQVVALGVPWITAYAATDGTELWRVDGLNGEVTPSPVFAGGLVIVASPSEKLLAIRPDGQGDVSKTHVAWTAEDNVPDITSPVSNGELVFTLSSAGVLTCFEAKDGKKQWEHDLEMEFHTSPSLAGARLYLFSQKGDAVVVEAARQYNEIFRTRMEDAFHASPAFVEDKIFLRGATNVWCLGGGAAR